MIDLRSDTVTHPTPAMLEAMMNAPVGDDVFGEDPTINALEEKAAKLFGMEAALFCPSGTMTNQIAIKLHTQPGDEVICHKLSHIYQYEGGGIAFNSGCSVQLTEGNKGHLKAEDVLDHINPDDVHKPVTRLVSLENTANKAGGTIYNFEDIRAIRNVCDEHHLKLHLDGARLFNALVETDETPKDYGRVFDTISICLSKGLGCPVGSLLLGSKADIRQARRIRKVFGGGMRQAGYLAAAGIYALDNHINRLTDDHRRAKELHQALQNASFIDELYPVETNIIIFRLNDDYTDKQFAATMQQHGVIPVQMARRLWRFSLHLDIDDEMLTKVISIIRKI